MNNPLDIKAVRNSVICDKDDEIDQDIATLLEIIVCSYKASITSPQTHGEFLFKRSNTRLQDVPKDSELFSFADPLRSFLLASAVALKIKYEFHRERIGGWNSAKKCDQKELNELRKPSSDNPEILRFFRYMKAAKDGQDGSTCELVHNNCIAPTSLNDASPMVTTFNDINKLVQARALSLA